MYKYSCRKCPVRDRCIDESENPTSTKAMVRAAFEAKTDTLATWGILQKHCLLLEADKARSKSALTDRLKKVQDAKDEAEALDEPDKLTSYPKRGVIRRLPQTEELRSPKNHSDSAPDYLKPAPPPKTKRPTKPLRRLGSTKPLAALSNEDRYWLTVVNSQRHIALPITGEISLGRFDPNVGIPPDIDLSYEDRKTRLISRRHASIIGRDGRHTIEDLGSRSGIFVNGKQVENDYLKPKDRISLGSIQLVYDKIPAKVFAKARSKDARHFLVVTPTGRKIPLPLNQKLVIGRADVQVNFMPDIDLSRDGELAKLVSRRHAVIRWRYGQPYVEDLGSGFGTRMKGEGLLLGQAVPLKPGDHIWLAGCVLAYDVEL